MHGTLIPIKWRKPDTAIKNVTPPHHSPQIYMNLNRNKSRMLETPRYGRTIFIIRWYTKSFPRISALVEKGHSLLLRRFLFWDAALAILASDFLRGRETPPRFPLGAWVGSKKIRERYPCGGRYYFFQVWRMQGCLAHEGRNAVNYD